jgi:hypothetical protein
VSWRNDRGWVAAQYLEYYYRNRYVLLPDYVDVIDVPIVPFALDTYWASYYVGRPWYHRQAYWNNYWRSNARFATQLPAGRSARGVETRTGAAIARDSIGRRGAADVRGARADRFAHENRATRGFVQGTRAQGIRETHQPMAGARHFEGNRFSAGPTPGRMAQPNVGRPGGASFAAHAQPSQPLAAHAQMGGPRPMGGGAGGGAPHINAAPHAGGGPAPAGGPPGRKH